MGSIGYSDLLTIGIRKAGAPPNISTAITDEFKAWIRTQATAFPWPVLQVRYNGIALAAGVSSLALGAGYGGISQKIHRLTDPIHIYNSTYTIRGKVRVSTIIPSEDQDADPNLNNPATNVGMPSKVRARRSGGLAGEYGLEFDRITDRAYLLAIDTWIVPSDPSGTNTFWYENDVTLIKAVEVLALHHIKAPNADLEEQKLINMTVSDRLKYGEIPGINQEWGLDPNTFK